MLCRQARKGNLGRGDSKYESSETKKGNEGVKNGQEKLLNWLKYVYILREIGILTVSYLMIQGIIKVNFLRYVNELWLGYKRDILWRYIMRYNFWMKWYIWNLFQNNVGKGQRG